MNWDQIEGKWKQVSGSLKQQWGKLTDDDLDVIAGQRDKLVGKLQERDGYAKEDAQKRADEWVKTADKASRESHETASRREKKDQKSRGSDSGPASATAELLPVRRQSAWPPQGSC